MFMTFFSLTLVLADANFPASSVCACGPKEIRADGMCDMSKLWNNKSLHAFVKLMHDPSAGLKIPQLLEAILKLLPLDTYVPCPVNDNLPKPLTLSSSFTMF